MTSPIWKTPLVSELGTVQEQEYFETILEAVVPDDISPILIFKIISGKLPNGLVLSKIDDATAKISGVPDNVTKETKSTFCVRIKNTKTGQIVDKTFTLSIIGEDTPTFVSSTKLLGTVIDGQFCEFQLYAIDEDNEEIIYSISKGELPKGLLLDNHTGKISGIVTPVESIAANIEPGWSSDAAWDSNEWDFSSTSISKNYEFDVLITDGKTSSIRPFSIFVQSNNEINQKRLPVFKIQNTDLGTVYHENNFAVKIDAIDFDYDILNYSFIIGVNIGLSNETNGFDSTPFDYSTSNVLPGLTLSTETGWLHGYIPNIGPIQKTFVFGVQAYKKDYPEYITPIKFLSLSVIGNVEEVIQWNKPSNLGTIAAGVPSEIDVLVSSTSKLQYEIYGNSRFPQGLKLLPNGLIVGKPSFEATSFDNYTTTVGIEFDNVYKFTVKACNSNNTITVYKDFILTIANTVSEPFENLYLKAMPSEHSRDIFNKVIFNTDIIPTEFIYRYSDPYFGKKDRIELMLISGIVPGTLVEHQSVLQQNHYRKELFFGEPTIGYAYDENKNIKYEILYLPITDTSANSDKEIFVDYANFSGTIYPNSLDSMRSQILSVLNLSDHEIIPDWMKTKKSSKWFPAVILSYLKPGTGNQVKFYLKKHNIFNQISFDVDRYVLDFDDVDNYDAISNLYLASDQTTFDKDLDLVSDMVSYKFSCNGTNTTFATNIDTNLGNVEVFNEQTVSGITTRTAITNFVITTNGNVVLQVAPAINTFLVVNYSIKQFEVDYAVDIPFNLLNGISDGTLNNLHGLDNTLTSYEGKTIIFAKQEQYSNYLGPYDGWFTSNSLWDFTDKWDDLQSFDEYEYINGYVENQNNNSVVNKRSGIWKFVRNENGLLYLEFVSQVRLSQLVFVKNGATYSNKFLQYGPLIQLDVGETVCNYHVVGERLIKNETVFDADNTKIVESITTYKEPSNGDKYLVFPKTNILG